METRVSSSVLVLLITVLKCLVNESRVLTGSASVVGYKMKLIGNRIRFRTKTWFTAKIKMEKRFPVDECQYRILNALSFLFGEPQSCFLGDLVYVLYWAQWWKSWRKAMQDAKSDERICVGSKCSLLFK
jgi:hypothetical protein